MQHLSACFRLNFPVNPSGTGKNGRVRGLLCLWHEAALVDYVAGIEELYVAGIEEIAWGVGLVAITMVLHGIAMVWTLRAVNKLKARLGPEMGLGASLFLLVVAAWLITVSHLVEVFAWARFFVWKGAMPNTSTAYYLALLDYTTLGCQYDLPSNWRLLEGMIAIAGLMTFAWSTSVFFAVAQEFQDRELRRAQRQGTSPESHP